MKDKIIITNFLLAIDNLNILTADLKYEIAVKQLIEITNVRDHFIYIPLDLVTKFHNKKHMINHHLYLCGHFGNCHIPKKWGALEYTTLDKLKQDVIQSC